MNSLTNKIILYFILVILFMLYFFFAFTGLLPLISYSYGLILMRFISGLANIDKHI